MAQINVRLELVRLQSFLTRIDAQIVASSAMLALLLRLAVLASVKEIDCRLHVAVLLHQLLELMRTRSQLPAQAAVLSATPAQVTRLIASIALPRELILPIAFVLTACMKVLQDAPIVLINV